MDGIVNGLIEKLENFLGRILYTIEKVVCMLLKWLQGLFNVFTGIEPAVNKGKKIPIFEFFFGNMTVRSVVLGMSVIGIIMAFTFAIIAVIRKGLDLDDKMRQSHGQILRSLLRSIFVIVSISLFMMIITTFTNLLMKSINDIFTEGPNLLKEDHIEFNDEQFAAMARIFNKVGNYSLNPSYNSRYNLNMCYNDIREDLKYLADTGVFNYYYSTESAGKKENTWQSVLQDIAVAADYTAERPADDYNEAVADSLKHCMDVLKNDNSFRALENYRDNGKKIEQAPLHLDRILFLSGTMWIGNKAAARNEAFNTNPAIDDDVRRPYYTGDKDIYDIDTVDQDFNLSVTRMNYLLVYIVGTALIVNMAIIMVNCIIRLFNMMFLYVIAPPIIAVSPLDDGGKFKQWITAFVVQAFSVFATVISMRLFLIFVPIVLSMDFTLVESPVLGFIGKIVMIWAGTIAIEKANGLLTGILADSAGWQSITAGSAAHDVRGSFVGRLGAMAQSKVEGAMLTPATLAQKAAGYTAKGAGHTAKGALNVLSLPVRPLVGAVGHGVQRLSSGWDDFKNKASNSIVQSPEYKKNYNEQKKQAEEQKKQTEESKAKVEERKEQNKYRKQNLAMQRTILNRMPQYGDGPRVIEGINAPVPPPPPEPVPRMDNNNGQRVNNGNGQRMNNNNGQRVNNRNGH